MDLGLTEVPVIVLGHLTAEQRRAYVLADNQLALNAGWDMELLQQEVIGLNLADFDLSLLGFAEEQIAGLLEGDPNFPPGNEDDQGQLDQLAPKEPTEIDCVCPSCGHEFIKQV
jgi:ParB-like chromosome segregation protein Spo0J